MKNNPQPTEKLQSRVSHSSLDHSILSSARQSLPSALFSYLLNPIKSVVTQNYFKPIEKHLTCLSISACLPLSPIPIVPNIP